MLCVSKCCYESRYDAVFEQLLLMGDTWLKLAAASSLAMGVISDMNSDQYMTENRLTVYPACVITWPNPQDHP